jgi:holo-[acyl-carrier protein] synthase
VIVGIGVDVVELTRFALSLERTPKLRSRIFTAAEGAGSVQSLAAAFAAKEAVAKALGAPPGLRWHDCLVQHEDSGRPQLAVSGTVADAAAALGVARWHLSLTHDDGMAIAMVVAEGDG